MITYKLPFDVSIVDLLTEGRRMLRADDEATEATKVGTFRVGSGGCITKRGPCGGCPRHALARFHGIQLPIEENRGLMFASGHSNEDVWIKELTRACTTNGLTLKREEEIPVVWSTAAGTPVTGRPDIVVVGPSGDPVRGIELKAVSSVWTAVTVRFDGTPKAGHLIQAGHYSWKLGLPYELWYTSRVDFVLPEWKQKLCHLPKDSPFCEYNKKGLVKKILPFDAGFALDWDGDRLMVCPVDGDNWTPTEITKSGINNYFELLDDMRTGKHLGPRITKYDAFGDESFLLCDPQYCKWSAICDSYEGDYDKWLTEIKKVSR